MVKPKRTQRELDEMRAKAYQSERRYQQLVKEKQAVFSSLINPVIPDPSLYQDKLLQEAKHKIAVKDKVNQLRNDITEGEKDKQKADKAEKEKEEKELKDAKDARALVKKESTDAQTKALNGVNEWLAQLREYQELKAMKLEDEENESKKKVQQAIVDISPIGVKSEQIAEIFKTVNVNNTPFEIKLMDSSSSSYQGRFPAMDELGVPSDVVLELLPRDGEIRTSVGVVGGADPDGDTGKYAKEPKGLTLDLLKALAQNTIDVKEETKQTYMDLFDQACGEYIRGSSTLIDVAPEEEKTDQAEKYARMFQRWYKFPKFEYWIAPAYNIPSYTELDKLLQRLRQKMVSSSSYNLRTKSERKASDRYSDAKENKRVKYPQKISELSEEGKADFENYYEERKKDNNSLTKDDAFESWKRSIPFKNYAKYTASKSGNGVITISPHDDVRLRRILILLGSKRAGNTADILPEITAILDALMHEGKIDKKKYKMIMRKYFHGI